MPSSASASPGTAALDRQGRLVSHDEAFARLSGQPDANLEGTDPFEVARDERWAELVAGRIQVFQAEHARRSARGDRSVLRLTFCRVPGEGGVAATLLLESVTAQRRADQRLAAQHAVAKVLAEATSISDASPRILQAICEILDTDIGGLWIVDRAVGRLRPVEGWVRPGIHAPEFLGMTRSMNPVPGISLPGHAWQHRNPVWIEDLPTSGPIFVRGTTAAKEGLHGAFAFPIVLGSDVLGVMDFFCREVRLPDAEMLQMLATFGSQIGQFMERKRIEEALRASEAQLQAIIDNTPSCVYVTDLEGRVLLLNRRTEAALGVTNAGARGRYILDILPPELRASAKSNEPVLRKGMRVLEREEVVNHTDGPHTYLTHRYLLHDRHGDVYAVCGISTDISATKRAEAHLRELAAELSAAEDRERKRLARDLHDSIGQTLSALKIDLARAEMNDALQVVDELIAQIRSMTFDLYPAMLDDLGLVPTLHTHSEQFTRRTNIRSSVTEIGTPLPLPVAVRNYLFRAIKELLNNVAKHANANEVLIAAHWRKDSLRIAVADDGRGFDPQDALEPRSRRGLGLADIHERVRAMGGHVFIEASPGHGSHVVLDIPIGEHTWEGAEHRG